MIVAALIRWLWTWWRDQHHPSCLARAPGWSKLAKEHLAAFPRCACCGSRKDVVPHHKVPVHVRGDLELDPTNLITLCPCCHLLVGHLKHWRSWNPDVVLDAAEWQDKILRRPWAPSDDHEREED